MPEYVLSDMIYDFMRELILDAKNIIDSNKVISNGFSVSVNISNYIKQSIHGPNIQRISEQFKARFPFYDVLYVVYIRKFFVNLLIDSSTSIIAVDPDEELADYIIDVSAYDSVFMNSDIFFKTFIRKFISSGDLNEMTRKIVTHGRARKEPIIELIRIISVSAVIDALKDTVVNGIYLYKIKVDNRPEDKPAAESMSDADGLMALHGGGSSDPPIDFREYGESSGKTDSKGGINIVVNTGTAPDDDDDDDGDNDDVAGETRGGDRHGIGKSILSTGAEYAAVSMGLPGEAGRVVGSTLSHMLSPVGSHRSYRSSGSHRSSRSGGGLSDYI